MPMVRSTVSFICKTIDWNNLEAISITFPVFFNFFCHAKRRSPAPSDVPSMNILYKNILCFVCILRHYITCLRVFVQNI